jgi:hypothetical protein
VEVIRLKRESLIQVPKTQSAFHPFAQRIGFYHGDVHQQSRLFVRPNQRPLAIQRLVSAS